MIVVLIGHTYILPGTRVYTYMYIYIYIERERYRERETYIYIYIYIYDFFSPVHLLRTKLMPCKWLPCDPAKLLSTPGIAALKASLPTCHVPRRSVLFTDTGTNISR